LRPAGTKRAEFISGGQWSQLTLRKELWPNMHGSREYSLVSPTTGFAVASNEFQAAPSYFKTTDGGQSFSEFTPQLLG
jgi:hypothetical protein